MNEAPSTAPVCYRHPSRETYIRCTRCERPICPDCMNEASVGHQCPECVAQGKRTQRPTRTAFGGSGVGRAGYATRTLIGINVLVMILSTIAGGAGALFGGSGGGLGGLLGTDTSVTRWGAVIGYAAYGPGGEMHGIAAGEWWRLITAMFLHYGLLHILTNMWALWQLGRYLEAALGPVRFVTLYLLAGLGGNVAAYLFTAPNQETAGASTAIFGLFLAAIVINRRLGLQISQLIPLLVVNLIITFTIPNISLAGHLGGMLVGGVVAVFLAYAPAHRRTLVQVIGCCAVLAVLIVATVLRTMSLLS
jgi:membrane associated rhomboid family serine protease